jgi:hypothetical protein
VICCANINITLIQKCLSSYFFFIPTPLLAWQFLQADLHSYATSCTYATGKSRPAP